MFNDIIANLFFNLGNLTKAVVNAKESLLKQVISKKQNELDLLSVSLAKKGQNISTIDKSNLEDLDKDRNNALREYSFSVIDQSQYNQQTLEFVNIIKDAFITENSREQLRSKETRDKLANFLKQYYDSATVESIISFFESMTSKNEVLGALSRLLTALVNNRRIYNDVNLQRAIADLFPLSMQYMQGEILNGESLILQTSNDQERLIPDMKMYMLILIELNNFSTEDTPEKQRAQFLIENYGKYALSVLDYPIIMVQLLLKSVQILDIYALRCLIF